MTAPSGYEDCNRRKSAQCGYAHRALWQCYGNCPCPVACACERNLELSAKALERAVNRLARPGIVLEAKENVPFYSADSDNPKILIRTLNGKTERGKFIDGKFQALA